MTEPLPQLQPRAGTLAWRAAQTQTVLDRFRDRPFSWNRDNCWKLTAAQARAMGHPFPPVPRFHSALGAKRALLKTGARDAAAFLDRHFVRLPGAAFALIGDLVLLPGDAEGESAVLDAVCVADGQGNLFGWHAANPSGLSSIKFAVSGAIGAWRL